MRKLPAVVAVLLAAAIGFAVSTLNTSVKRAAEDYADSVRAAGHYKVTIGSTGIGFSPLPAVFLRDLVVEDTGQADDREVLRVPVVRVKPRLLPMLVGLVRVAGVELESPTLTVKRLATGRVTLGSWIAGVSEDQVVSLPLPIHVRGGEVVWEEHHDDPPVRWVSKNVSLDLEPTDDEGTTRFSLELSPTGPSSRVRAEGSIRPTGEKTKGLRVDLRYTVAGLDVETTNAFPRIGDARLVGVLELAGQAHGYAGGERTESMPAEKLTITAKGKGTLAVGDLREPLELDMVLSDKEGRLRFEKASLAWNGIDMTLSGWTSHFFDHPAVLRLNFEHADSDRLLEQFGVPRRWRPRALLSGEISMEGRLSKPLMRYTADTDGIKMDFYEGYEVEVGPSEIKGLLLQSSADFSAVIASPFLRLGRMRVEPVSFGARYWRDKLGVNMANLKLWDGLGTVSARHEPLKANEVEVAGLFDDLDAAVALENVFPDLEPDIAGRMDAIVQVGSDDSGTWAMGRIGLHRGSFTGFSLADELFEEIASHPGLAAFADPKLKSDFGHTFGTEDTEFRMVKFNFKSHPDGFDLGSVKIDLDGIEIRGSGSMDPQGVIDVEADMALRRRLADAMVRKAPDLRRLVAADGEMHVPVHIGGRLESLSAQIGPRFLEVAARALAGRQVVPFAPLEPGPALEIELPKLEEQYGR